MKKHGETAQQQFLTGAMATLGFSLTGFATRLGVSDVTVSRWLAPANDPCFTVMPERVWRYVREMLSWRQDTTTSSRTPDNSRASA